MRRMISSPSALLLLVTVAFPFTSRGGPDPESTLQERLIGTWKLATAKYDGQEVKLGEGSTTIKHVTPAHFMWLSYDQDGKITRSAGGIYTLKTDDYVETPEYGLGGDFEVIKGKPQTFKCKIEGNKWFHNGKLSNDLTIEEVWERVEKK